MNKINMFFLKLLVRRGWAVQPYTQYSWETPPWMLEITTQTRIEMAVDKILFFCMNKTYFPRHH